MYGYDLRGIADRATAEQPFASIGGKIIADDGPGRLAVLMPHWPVVELPAGVTTVSPDEWVDGHLVWSPEAGQWVASRGLQSAIAEATQS